MACYIDVVGFYFLDLASDYKPPDNLAKFLSGGDPPVYIGYVNIDHTLSSRYVDLTVL